MTSSTLDPFDLDWQSFCLEQGDLPGLAADDLVGAQTRGRHSSQIWLDQHRFSASLDESLVSEASGHYPILTVSGPHSLDCDETSETDSALVARPAVIDSLNTRTPSTRAARVQEGAGRNTDGIFHAGHHDLLGTSFQQKPQSASGDELSVSSGQERMKPSFVGGSGGTSQVAQQSSNRGNAMAGDTVNSNSKHQGGGGGGDGHGFVARTPPLSPSVLRKDLNQETRFFPYSETETKSRYSKNISNPAFRDRTRAKLEENTARVDMFRSVTLPPRSSPSIEVVGKYELSRPKPALKKSNSDSSASSSNQNTSSKRLQPVPSSPFERNKAISNVTKAFAKIPSSSSMSEEPENTQPAQSIAMSSRAPDVQDSRKVVRSSITLARALTPSPGQVHQMYGLPGLDSSPLPPNSLFSNRLNPFSDSADDVDIEVEDLTYTLQVARDSKHDIPTPHRGHRTATDINASRFFSGAETPARDCRDNNNTTSQQASAAKPKGWWRKPNFTFGKSRQKSGSVQNSDAAERQVANKNFLFGQSVTVGVMRKLGMGKNASKTAQAQWNNMARAQEEYQKSHRGIESAVAPVLSNKNTAPAASSAAIAKSKNSDSGTVRIVNGVRVTGSTTRRSLDYGAPGRAAPKGPRQADRSAECSGESLECSCSLYHSHHFPGQPVNRDVLARVERREDAIMASLRMEEETMQHRDMSETPHNIFWTPTLTFHPYSHGDALVEFPSLWPSYKQLREHLQNSGIQNTVLRGESVLDLCVLACTCGPAHLLQCLIELQLIRVDQTLDDGSGLLHLAVLAQNAASVQYLVQARVSPRIRDRRGLTADQLCFSSHIRRLMAPRYVLSRDVSRDRVLLQPSLQDKDVIFKMAASPTHFVEIQRRLQTLDFNVNTECDNTGDFLLHSVVRQGLGQLPLLMALVKIQRADIELCNADGMTALMLTAAAGNCVLTDVLICLFGADPNKPNSQSGRSALHYATEGNHRKTVECLIRRGADVNLEDHEGLRPDDIPVCSRMSAVMDDCSEVIRFNRTRRLDMLAELVRKNELRSDQLVKSDFCVVDDQEYTLVMTAVLANRTQMLSMLLRFSDSTINAQHSKTGMTALAMAAQAGYKESVGVLLSYGASAVITDMQGYLPLHHAVLNNHEGAVEEILEHFPNTYVGIHKAIRMCKRTSIHTRLRDAWDKRQEEIVTPKMLGCALVGEAKELYLLLDEGDNINPKSGTGNWPLYLAVENGHLDVVKLLFERGGDIRKRHPTTGATVLHVAASMGHQAVVNFLLQYCRPTTPTSPVSPTFGGGGFLDSQMFQPMQPVLARAASFSSLVWAKATSGSGAGGGGAKLGRGSPGAPLVAGGGVRKQLLDINAVDKDGKTAMQLAAEKGLSNIVELLLGHGATTSLLDEHGQLVTCPQFEGLRIMVERHRHNHTREVMRLILEGKGRKGLEQLRHIWLPKFDHHLRTKEGDTPLMLAAYKGRVPVLEFLLRSAVYSEASQHESDSDNDSDADSGVLDPSLGYKYKEDFALSMDAGPAMASLSSELPSEIRPMIHDWKTLNSSELVSKRVSRMVSDATRPKELSIFHDGVISHVCAVNLRNGSTALHNAVRGGDSAQCLSLLLTADRDPLNAQDAAGETVLHTACRLNRRKCVELLLTFPELDLDIRTLEGSLASEIATSKTIVKMLEKAKSASPPKDIDTSLLENDVQVRPAGSDKSPSMLGSTVNFDKVHSRYEALKYGVNPLGLQLTAGKQDGR